MEQRVKGVDTEILIVSGDPPEPQIVDAAIKSFELTIKLETKEEMYLGEKSNRHDDIFNGVSGSIDFHSASGGTFTLIKAIIERASRRSPSTKFNLKATLNYPNGDTPRVLIPDVHWGDIPISASSKNDYVGFKLSFVADDLQVLEG